MNKYKEVYDSFTEEHSFKGLAWSRRRDELVEEYSPAVPNEDALIYLAEFDSLVEAGQASGYWAECIEERGGSVEESRYIEEEAVLLVWPGQSSWATHVVKEGPSHVLYVGEPRGGCTASEEFFDALDPDYGLVAKIDIPSYAGANDDLYHYVRKL